MPASASTTRRAAAVVVPALVAFGVLIAGWQLLAVHNPLVLPTVPQIYDALAHDKLLFAKDAGYTLLEAVVGLAIGFTGAVVVGIAMSQIRFVERAVMPLAVVLNVTPLVALAPGLAIALGFGLLPKYVVTAIIVFFPFLINFTVGLFSVEAGADEVFHTIGASRADTLRRLQMPSSLPYLFAAARICFPLALVGAVVAELTVSGTSPGLGVEISQASRYLQLGDLYAAVVCLTIIGSAMYAVVVVVEHRTLGWYRATRGALPAGRAR